MKESLKPRTPVTVEDLLRLKRAERPSAEFWAAFDRQMRVKQLTAIVDRQPWWRAWPRSVVSAAGRYQVPLGAAALVALTMVTVRHYQKQDEVLPAVAPEMAVNQAQPAVIQGTSTHDRRTSSSQLESKAQVASGGTAARQDFGVTQGGMLIGAAGAETPAVEAPTSVAVTGSVNHQVADVAVALPSEQEIISAPESVEVAEASVPLANLDPLAQVAGPREVRRSRLLAYNVPLDPRQNENVVHTRERITSRLNEQALYDSISRLGLSGDSVSIKF